MGLDSSRLRRGEVIVGVGGLVLLASTFVLSWYDLKLASGPAQSQLFVKTSVDGWHGLHHARWLVVLTLLAAFALVILQASRPAPALPISAAVAVTILSALTVLWLIFRVLVSAPGDQKLGAYIGLISACVIVYGGYESMRKEGIASRDEPKEIPTVTLEQEPGS